MHHASSHDLDEARLLAERTSFSIALEAGDVHLHARFHEGKIAGTKSHADLFAEKFLEEDLKHALQVRERNVAADHEPFNLVELGLMGGIRRLIAEYFSRR